MEKEFQFAVVADWYEETFGKPLALFPEQSELNDSPDGHYAMPANGIILKP